MNVLDENIFELHRQQLDAWGIRVRQVGVDIGKLGMDDREEIIPLLHSLRRPTFLLATRTFTIGGCVIQVTAWSTSTSHPMKRPDSFAVSCATVAFARKRREWVRSFASTRVASAYGKGAWAKERKLRGDQRGKQSVRSRV
jgi:hypothetical protein